MSGNQSESFDGEYRALRAGRAIIDLAGWSSISIAGSDRQAFLNNFCTNDVKGLVPGSSCEAFFTSVKGKIIGHGVIDCQEDELVFLGAPGQAQRLVEHLDRYVIREDVQLRDTTLERNYLLFTNDVRSRIESSATISWNLIGGEFGIIAELAASDAPSLISRLRDRGYVVAGPDAFTAVRIEAGTPLYGIDFSDQNFPQEVGRDREAISFTKGCYLGQETVARIDALGHVNQKIVGVAFSGPEVPTVGTDLTHNGAIVGRVTSATFSPALGRPLALATVRREHNAVGTVLNSPVGNCEVVALPVRPTRAAS